MELNRSFTLSLHGAVPDPPDPLSGPPRHWHGLPPALCKLEPGQSVVYHAPFTQELHDEFMKREARYRLYNNLHKDQFELAYAEGPTPSQNTRIWRIA